MVQLCAKYITDGFSNSSYNILELILVSPFYRPGKWGSVRLSELQQSFSNWSVNGNHLGIIISVGLGRGSLGFFISNKLPGGADAAGLDGHKVKNCTKFMWLQFWSSFH